MHWMNWHEIYVLAAHKIFKCKIHTHTHTRNRFKITCNQVKFRYYSGGRFTFISKFRWKSGANTSFYRVTAMCHMEIQNEFKTISLYLARLLLLPVSVIVVTIYDLCFPIHHRTCVFKYHAAVLPRSLCMHSFFSLLCPIVFCLNVYEF